ncbi:MAG: glycoside hydrolase family 15 protein [Pirellulales bacterium]
MVAQPKIGDYGAIGDGRSVGLISSDGSLDWLCWPRFDSPAVFARLLDAKHGGCWRIGPLGLFTCSRRYIEHTNVLETRFTTADGQAVLADFMPVGALPGSLQAEQELIRRLLCTAGTCRIQVIFEPRPGFATQALRLKDRGRLGVCFQAGSQLFSLRSEAPFSIDASGRVHCDFAIHAGEAINFSLILAQEGPAVYPPLGDNARTRMDATVGWWRQWAGRCRYEGPFREAVVRSALVLKLLSFAPSGAIIAAPTTSLPERIGGDLNWDYRYCWLRDAAFTTRALLGLGYEDEAQAFVSWLLHATRLTRPKLRVLYDVYGCQTLPEKVLPHLPGYADSRPVRVGNLASQQLQLDVYGELIEAVRYLAERGNRLDRDACSMLRQAGEFVCRHWQEPDHGIWEVRPQPKHFTHSRLMCWTALDRLIRLHADGKLPRIPSERFAAVRDRIRADIEQFGWNSGVASYTQTLGGSSLDAALLFMPLYGFEEPAADRMRQTAKRIEERLCAGEGLLYRYEESRTMGEGAFGICAFWLADYLARLGEVHRSAGLLHSILRYANDLGLFAEEIDPNTGDALGNFPQAYTHVGLINAALSLVESERGAVEPSRNDRLTATTGVP